MKEALALLEDANRLLWDVRILAESMNFTNEFFYSVKDVETNEWDVVLALKNIIGEEK